MGGGGKGSTTGPEPWEQSAMEHWGTTGYNYGFAGNEMPVMNEETGEYSFPMPYDTEDRFAPYWEQGYARGQADWQKQQMQEQLQEMLTSAGAAAPAAPSGPSLAEQRAKAEQQQGEGRRNSLNTEYMDSVDMATDYVNAQITKEISNANLLGIEYTLDDAQKQSRIENYFASIWGEGQDQEMKAMNEKWGTPKGFNPATLARGDASLTDLSIPGSEEEIAKTAPKVKQVEEEEGLGGETSILG